MVKFLFGKELKREIESILAEDGCRCAVAFWGNGSEKKLPDFGRGNFKVICNLVSGGTNPHAIKKLKRQNVRQLDTLHAKVYIGSKNAVITSANVSANGLGSEAEEQAKWLEAGVTGISGVEPLRWFDDLWNQSRPITDSDLAIAVVAWKRRQSGRPLPSLSEVRLDALEGAKLFWVGDAKWEPNEKRIRQEFGDFSPRTRRMIDESLAVERGDNEAMSDGTWLLVWERNRDGSPSGRSNPYWFHCGRIVDDAFKYVGEPDWVNAVIESESVSTEPFNLREPGVIELIRELLLRPDFVDLRAIDYKPPFFSAKRLGDCEHFWIELKREFKAQRSDEVST